ncbi:hypothetical protein V6N13_104415 [Hibiscus sabdariffa]
MFDLPINTTLDPKTLELPPTLEKYKEFPHIPLPRVLCDFFVLQERVFGIFALKFIQNKKNRALEVAAQQGVGTREGAALALACRERKENVFKELVPDELGANAPRDDKDKFKKHMDDMLDVGYHMLATMTPKLQKQHEDMVAYEMIQNLKEIYEREARQERYETSKALFQCKMSKGSPVGAYVIKIMDYIQTLEKLRFPLKDELATDVILQSLPDSFKPFVLNFNMNKIDKTLPQLLGMLRTA